MAAKKTKSTKSTESTKSTKTTKKTKSKTVNLTFAPILGAADQFSVLLRKKVIKDGIELPTYVPKIEGLPMKLVVKKGEVVSVTEEQFEQLQALGLAETDEEYEERKKFIKSLSEQHPRKLTWDMIVAEGTNFATLHESQFIIYNDKLIKV